MYQKLKFNEKHDKYRLHMNENEVQLVFALLARVRLGSDNVFSEAAFTLNESFSDCVGSDFYTDVQVSASFKDSEGIILEVDESHDW